ncbi:GyrI-like domain-containing protein [Bacillus salitolerans]|uniref:GyrI-like domain-containing protein n=1 Tax=Bacillus salitolerans TaxID=1437434 RepID=A0ABW4LUY2_9BACI
MKTLDLKIVNSVRTNNFKDELIMQKIIGLWNEASSVLDNRNVITYGVYHDYESDYKGDYTVSVAIESNDHESSIQITDESSYEIFIVDQADEHGVINTWKEIWNREESGSLRRAYTYDFEKYCPNGKIEIHIAVK